MPLAGSGLSADQPLSDMLKIPFHSSFHKVLSVACFFSAAFAPTLTVSRLLQFQVLQLPVLKQRRVFFPETAGHRNKSYFLLAEILLWEISKLPPTMSKEIWDIDSYLCIHKQKMTARLYYSIMGQCFQGNWHSPDKLAASPLSRSA